jgi:hypothetical protein
VAVSLVITERLGFDKYAQCVVEECFKKIPFEVAQALNSGIWSTVRIIWLKHEKICDKPVEKQRLYGLGSTLWDGSTMFRRTPMPADAQILDKNHN